MSFSYKVTADNEILITKKGESVPVISQPHWPDGTPFENSDDASIWAQAAVDRLNGVETEVLPGPSAKMPTQLVSELPTEEDMALEEVPVSITEVEIVDESEPEVTE